MEMKMSIHDRINHYMNELKKACDDALVERVTLVPKRHYDNLEGCIQRCIDMIETLANRLPSAEKELRNDARIYLGILRGLIEGRTIEPYRTIDEQRKINIKKTAADSELSRPKRAEKTFKVKVRKKGSKK
jgi:hypothetical protein